jgi:hypothetical protein
MASRAVPISCSFGASAPDDIPSGRGVFMSTQTQSNHGRFSFGTSGRMPRSTKIEDTASLTLAK